MNIPRDKNKDLDLFLELMNNLYRTAKKELNFSEAVSVKLINDKDNSFNPLGKTAAYNPATKEVVLYFAGRHPKDLLRSFSHELVHHAQNCRGDFDNIEATNEGYAQENSHLREMEREAYECGNMIFRDWEDGIKKRGVVPMFNNSPFATIQMGYNENLGETEMSKKNLSESQLREIIRGVIQEMFEEDLNEENVMDETVEEVAEESVDVALEEESAAIEEQSVEELEESEEIQEEVSEEVVEEDLQESYLPKGRSIRESARQQTYAKLVEKWCK